MLLLLALGSSDQMVLLLKVICSYSFAVFSYFDARRDEDADGSIVATRSLHARGIDSALSRAESGYRPPIAFGIHELRSH